MMRELRSRLGLTQNELARAIGSHQTEISQLETSFTSPKLRTGEWRDLAVRVARALGATPEQIWPEGEAKDGRRAWALRSSTFARIRTEKKLSVYELARRAGTQPAVISALSTGRLSPVASERNWRRRRTKWKQIALDVAGALDTPPEELWPAAWKRIADLPIPEVEEKELKIEQHARRILSLRDFWLRMPAREQIMLGARAEGRTLAEIGKAFGVTRERVRQIEVDFLERVACANGDPAVFEPPTPRIPKISPTTATRLAVRRALNRMAISVVADKLGTTRPLVRKLVAGEPVRLDALTKIEGRIPNLEPQSRAS